MTNVGAFVTISDPVAATSVHGVFKHFKKAKKKQKLDKSGNVNCELQVCGADLRKKSLAEVMGSKWERGELMVMLYPNATKELPSPPPPPPPRSSKAELSSWAAQREVEDPL